VVQAAQVSRHLPLSGHLPEKAPFRVIYFRETCSKGIGPVRAQYPNHRNCGEEPGPDHQSTQPDPIVNICRSSLLVLAAGLGTAILSPLSATERRPAAITQHAPAFPYLLRQSGCDGAVLVAFTVTAKGDVADASVVSSTMSEFDLPTLRAIKKWKFIPGTKDGVAVDTPVCQLVAFIIRPHDRRTTTARLVKVLWARNPRACDASGWQPSVANAEGPIVASGETFSQARP